MNYFEIGRQVVPFRRYGAAVANVSASHFFTAQTHVWVVGYYFEQVTGDSCSGAVLGDFKSKMAGFGPRRVISSGLLTRCGTSI